eukprot:CAMPEP_0183306336 /NCGR_PEP_ID=MMETSP0160_2-20130417/10789_1 /TAXON_ID=2839 ORGANISM="Odontella Sinensis, Strain Grunow 1884" /NCGR_SAMPLE_ID=MMETSP0160_2 /ASSEMBLY_ACC=CAM_ASM_000250 /LENGTH=258 /DNA_ID=CAMNT_0025469687 /DNA_START=108 /DNA_END=884 /DNA_ORIENTATION=+
MKVIALLLLVPLLAVVVSAAPSSPPENAARRTRMRGGAGGGLRAPPDSAFMEDIEDESMKFWTRELRSLGSSGEVVMTTTIEFKVDSICGADLDDAGVEGIGDAVLKFVEEHASCRGSGVVYDKFELIEYEDPEDCDARGGYTAMYGYLTDRGVPSVCPGDSECPSPCTHMKIFNGDFYHPHCVHDGMFIQCDEFKGCFEMPCAPGTAWSQSHLTCVHAAERAGDPAAVCDDDEMMADALRSEGFDIDSVRDVVMEEV